MNRITTLFLMATVCTIFSFGAPDQIVLRKTGPQHDHLDQPIPADQPDVYLDTSNAAIFIDGGGEVTYYDVEIESMTTWLTVISTQVNGMYDTIDVSSLTSGEYMITISSPTGHEFEGFFQIEKQ